MRAKRTFWDRSQKLWIRFILRWHKQYFRPRNCSGREIKIEQYLIWFWVDTISEICWIIVFVSLKRCRNPFRLIKRQNIWLKLKTRSSQLRRFLALELLLRTKIGAVEITWSWNDRARETVLKNSSKLSSSHLNYIHTEIPTSLVLWFIF